MEFNWFIFSLIAAFSFTGMTLLFRIVTDKGISPLIGIFYILLVATILFGIYNFSVEKSFILNKNIIILLIIAGAFSFIGNAAISKAIASASNPGYAQAVGSFRIVLITFISILLFNLKPNILGILGSVFVFTGLFLLSTVS